MCVTASTDVKYLNILTPPPDNYTPYQWFAAQISIQLTCVTLLTNLIIGRNTTGYPIGYVRNSRNSQSARDNRSGHPGSHAGQYDSPGAR